MLQFEIQDRCTSGLNATECLQLVFFFKDFFVCGFTSFGSAEAVVSRHVLDVVNQRRVGQKGALEIQTVHGVLEGQFGARVLLILAEYSSCDRSQPDRRQFIKQDRHFLTFRLLKTDSNAKCLKK